MPLFNRRDREAVGTAGVALGLVALMFGFFAFVVAAHADNRKIGTPAGAVQVSLTEYAITPTTISAPLNGKLVVSNAGTTVHNFNVQGTAIHTKDLQPGETATVDLKGLKAGTYTSFCAISGHQQLGMQASLIVGGSSASTGAASGMASMDFNSMSPQQLAAMNDQMDATMAKAVDIYTAQLKNGPNTKGVGNQPLVPRVLPDGTKVFNLTTQTPIEPGKSFTYEFTVNKPELGMYHSHQDAQVQVPDGMLGVFQVGDPALPPNTGPVTQAVPIVLNDAGVIGLSINGKSFPATAPIIAHPGDWVELNYFNEGLQIHPMHLHGLPQLVIGEDGYPLSAPYTVDTLAVAPGQRFTTLVHVTSDFLGPNNTPGIWAFHCHILTHAEGPNGMFGMVTTFIVEPR